MIQSLNGIMIELERQKAAIERALAALREVGATITTAQIEPAVSKRKRFSAKVRRKMALAQKARWAKAKNEMGAAIL